MKRNLVLVGFMATGKTEVGKLLAKKLERDFVDVDDNIVSTTGMSIDKIFEDFGEDFFRDLESNIIQKISDMTDLVIATGGGSLLRPENVENLKRTGVLVCLTASPKEILRRVGDERHRPLLNVKDRLTTIREMMEKRNPYYNLSDIMVNTEGKNTHETAQEILAKFKGCMDRWRK